MAKKTVGVSLRKPPPPADLEQFVRHDSDVRELARHQTDAMVMSPSGRELRELTVYLPPELARKLALYCHEQDRDTSKVLAEILDGHLDQAPAPMPMPETPQWQQVVKNLTNLVRARFGWT
jgi:hypothetical protein